jgi:hypothetical protein
MRHVKAFYDEAVRPAAREVFGEAHLAHWPLSASHYLWKDRHMNGTMTWSMYGCTNENQTRPMEAFLRKIDLIINGSDNPTVKDLRGVRLVVQRQNEKLQNRLVNVFSHNYPTVDLQANNSIEMVQQAAARYVLDATFQNEWDYQPPDTQVDLALEIESKELDRCPYVLRSSHADFLSHYIEIESSQARRETEVDNRRTEHSRYKLDRVAGLDVIAGFHYKPQTIGPKGVREMKVYFTGKEVTYNASSRHKYRGIPAVSLLSKTSTYTQYQKSLQDSLEKAVDCPSSLRIEVTLPFTLAESFQYLPDAACSQGIVMLPKGIIP